MKEKAAAASGTIKGRSSCCDVQNSDHPPVARRIRDAWFSTLRAGKLALFYLRQLLFAEAVNQQLQALHDKLQKEGRASASDLSLYSSCVGGSRLNTDLYPSRPKVRILLLKLQ